MPILMNHGETSIVISGDLTAYLSGIGEVVGDITESIFMIKSDRTVADLSAEYQTASVTYDGNTIKASIDDFTNLLVGTEYYYTFGIKFAGDSTYRELKIKAGKDTIKFTQDLIRG